MLRIVHMLKRKQQQLAQLQTAAIQAHSNPREAAQAKQARQTWRPRQPKKERRAQRRGRRKTEMQNTHSGVLKPRVCDPLQISLAGRRPSLLSVTSLLSVSSSPRDSSLNSQNRMYRSCRYTAEIAMAG